MRAHVLVLAVLAAACGRKSREIPASAAEGARVFGAACARCHGVDGKGGPPLGPGAPVPRNLTDEIFHTARTDDDIRHVIKNGKGTAMPAFGAVLPARDIEAVLLHIRSLDPRR